MTIEDCEGNSYFPQSQTEPVAVPYDETDASFWVCLPSDIGNAGIKVTVDGGTWGSEESWEIVGPCGDDDDEVACKGGSVFLEVRSLIRPTTIHSQKSSANFTKSFLFLSFSSHLRPPSNNSLNYCLTPE